MSLKYVLLGLLSQHSRYGYVLKGEAEQLLGNGSELNPGQLYPLLHRLAKEQLLEGERVEQEDRPDKRIFTLTEAGRRELNTWFDEPVPLSAGRSALFLRYVVLALVRPEAQAAFLKEQRRRLLECIGQLVADRAKHEGSEDLSTRALRELTLSHTEADLKWIEWLASLESQDTSHSN